MEIGVYVDFVFFALVVFLGVLFVMSIKDRKKISQKKDLAKIYFGEKSYRKHYVKIFDLQAAFYKFCLFNIVFLTAIFLAYQILGEHMLVVYIHNHAETLTEIMFENYIAVVGFLSILKEWNKKSYLVFSVNDLLQYCQAPKILLDLAILVFAAWMCWFMIPLGEQPANNAGAQVFEALIICLFAVYLFYIGRIIAIIFDIILNSKMEKKILNNLYMEWWYKNPKRVYGKWNEDGIEENISYLSDQYMKNGKKVHILNVKFDTNLNKRDKNFKIMKRRSSLAAGFLTFMFLFIVMACCYINLLEKEKIVYYVAMSVLTGLACVLLGIYTSLGDAFIQFGYGRSGYHIKAKGWKREKTKFATDVSFRINDRYIKYIQSAKNLIAYFNISLQNDKKVKAVFRAVKREQEKNQDIDMILLIMDYLYFKKKKKHIACLDIKSISAEKISFARAIVRDIERTVKDGELTDESFEKYMKSCTKACS